ncbi:MAG: hypothetical protein H6P96_374, partial [Candidatus Aminicenantes bacterium]|nr:hypothetical protein [Candidatus Aminicenantes bacterium]MBS1226400.1 hypothetical protein [Candidatus Aminicenantes bacterium]
MRREILKKVAVPAGRAWPVAVLCGALFIAP